MMNPRKMSVADRRRRKSEDNVHGSNQKDSTLWTRIHKMFEEARAENLEDINARNVDSLKGCWKRLSENGNKWVAAYKEAYGRKRSGMDLNDIEKEAHAIFEANGSKFVDLHVFKEVMSKHPKWKLKFDHDSTRFRFENEDEESGGSSKRVRTSEDGEYSIPSNPEETPSSGGSTIPRPIGRDKTRNKGKGKSSQSSATNEVAAEIRALRLTRDNEVEVMNNLENARIELELKKEQRKKMKMKEVMLNILLARDHLSPEDEEMKLNLMTIVFGE